MDRSMNTAEPGLRARDWTFGEKQPEFCGFAERKGPSNGLSCRSLDLI
jgi:hypothetical protein